MRLLQILSSNPDWPNIQESAHPSKGLLRASRHPRVPACEHSSGHPSMRESKHTNIRAKVSLGQPTWRHRLPQAATGRHRLQSILLPGDIIFCWPSLQAFEHPSNGASLGHPSIQASEHYCRETIHRIIKASSLRSLAAQAAACK